MPSVSVIIPTWNRADTLLAALRGALDQTHSPTEILVCDDGSTDNTAEIVAGICDPRVRYLPGVRGGRPAIPRNRGIAASSGEWLAFLDSDDEWLPQKLEQQLALATRLRCRAACGNARRIIAGGIAADLLSPWPEEVKSLDDMLLINRVVCSSAIIHRSLLPRVIGFPEAPQLKALEDYAFWLRVATQTPFAYVHEPLVRYYDNLSTSVRRESISDEIRQRRMIYADFIAWLHTHRGEHGLPTVEVARIERACQIRLWRMRGRRLKSAVRQLSSGWPWKAGEQ